MKRLEQIIESYQQADHTTRMELYLLHRDLRNQFDQIEHSEADQSKQPETQSVIRPVTENNLILRLCAYCRSVFTHLLSSFNIK